MKLENLKKMPLIQTRVRRIQDSDLVIHQTIISDIRPIGFYEAVCDRSDKRTEVKINNLVREVIG
jgi:hypothetical protein